MSRTFSTKSGSVDSLKVSLRCGWSENARQMRCTVEIDTPEALAIERVLQCVESAGIVSSVVVTTSAIFSSSILRGAPGRGSSTRPSKRLIANRLRHVATVSRLIPRRSAIARIGHSIGRQQHDLRPHRVAPRDLPAACAPLQFAALLFAKTNTDRRTPRHPNPQCLKGAGNHATRRMARNF